MAARNPSALDYLAKQESRIRKLERQGSGWLSSGSFSTNCGNYNTITGPANFADVRFRKFPNGMVLLDGLMGFSGARTAGLSLYTLPEGFRPEQTDALFIALATGNTLSRIDISSAGVISCTTTFALNGFLNLTGLTFFAVGQ